MSLRDDLIRNRFLLTAAGDLFLAFVVVAVWLMDPAWRATGELSPWIVSIVAGILLLSAAWAWSRHRAMSRA